LKTVVVDDDDMLFLGLRHLHVLGFDHRTRAFPKSMRPARKQIAGSAGPKKQEHSSNEPINIWYGKRCSRDEKELKIASTRCRPSADSGSTLAGEYVLTNCLPGQTVILSL
jgi:hypothetical protein